MHTPRGHEDIGKMFAASRRKGTAKVRVAVSATVVSLQRSSGWRRFAIGWWSLPVGVYITMSMTAVSFAVEMAASRTACCVWFCLPLRYALRFLGRRDGILNIRHALLPGILFLGAWRTCRFAIPTAISSTRQL
jgi:hypothetical protein